LVSTVVGPDLPFRIMRETNYNWWPSTFPSSERNLADVRQVSPDCINARPDFDMCFGHCLFECTPGILSVYLLGTYLEQIPDPCLRMDEENAYSALR